MSDRLTLRDRLRGIAREAAKFGAVGTVGFLVNVIVFNLCGTVAGLPPLIAGVIATSAAICANYLGNRYWTYRHRDKSRKRREASLFLLFSGAGMVIENGVLALSHYGLGFTSPLADNLSKNVIGLGIGALFRFWSYRTWVFRTASPSAGPTPSSPSPSPSPPPAAEPSTAPTAREARRAEPSGPPPAGSALPR